jgi:hypothetical protein
VNCVNHNGESIITTNLNLIHFFNILNYKNWVQKTNLICNFCKKMLELPAK